MTDQEPDGPMPLCMSPESFRAAVDRAKKAERERDEALANVATLVEQLGEAERKAALYRADREGVYRSFEQAMNERDALRELLRRRHETRSEDSQTWRDFLRHIDNVLAGKPTGAAQPVVEPRDETGVRWEPGCSCPNIGGKAEHLQRVDTCRVHGYAPHPSGTEGPLREEVRRLRCALESARQDVAACHWSSEVAHDGVVYSRQHCLAVIDAALAASPPDGTAPERARLIDLLRQARDCLGCSDEGLEDERELAKVIDAELGDLPVGRPARWNAPPLLATRPPDGMPGEPTWCSAHDTAQPCGYCSEGMPAAGAAPPTVPGEPLLRYEADDSADTAGLRVECDDYGDGVVTWKVVLSGEDEFHEKHEAEAAMQEYALGIASNVRAVTPPTPPLTPERAPAECICPPNAMAVRCPVCDPPERAPLDEAAVRADERRRAERDIAAKLMRDASMGHLIERATRENCARMIERSDYPRRSEGAG